jgi:hypothetical protein
VYGYLQAAATEKGSRQSPGRIQAAPGGKDGGMSTELPQAEVALSFAKGNKRRIEELEGSVRDSLVLLKAALQRLESLEDNAKADRRRIELLEDEIRILRTAISTNMGVPR